MSRRKVYEYFPKMLTLFELQRGSIDKEKKRML